MSTAPEIKPPGATFFGFPVGYWMLNVIEMWERMAYFAVRSVVAIYIMQADETYGLHFTAVQKGHIFAWWFIFQSILPMFTGGYADRYGYKKTLAFSVTLNIIGYIMMAFMTSFWGFFTAVMVLATGTAFFKPSLQGSLAQNVTKENSSLGWGIFYWVVNVGAMIAPLLAGFIRNNPAWEQNAWQILFLTSAGITFLNYIMLFTFKDYASGADKTLNPLQVFVHTLKNIFEIRLIIWLLIMSSFWLMMYQLWDLHPNFLTDWNDSSDVASIIPDWRFFETWVVETARGPQVPQEYLITLNAALIVVLMIPVSWMVRKLRTLEAMVIGMSVATAGVIVAGFTNVGGVFLLGVALFSLGEMLTGPKKNEYLGLIAPPGKKGLYLGYVNIPIGIGGFTGSQMAGFIYGTYGEKAVLAQKYLVQHTEMGEGVTWTGNIDRLSEILNVPRTEAFVKLQQVTGLDAQAATKLLWDTYHPQYAVWVPFIVIGVIAVIALVIFAKLAQKWDDMNA
ncbi:MFS transporter [bacterium]|nr:MFS transporter [bacterium]